MSETQSEAQTEAWTIKRLLDWTTEYFGRCDSDSPRLEAEVLLAEALGCERIQLYTQFNEVPQEPALGNYRAWVKRRAAGEPVAYLVGHREFYSLKFVVSEHVLIPRPETEHVVVEAIECSKHFQAPIRIADVGTGSGCIAVALAKHLPNSRITAFEISPEALNLALQNAKLHGVSNQIEFCESDLFASFPEGQFEIIASNPPYVGTREVETLDANVRKFEPEIALFSGPKGTELIERLLAESVERLVVGGYLVFETSPIVMESCLALVAHQSRLEHQKTVRDLAGHQRVVVCKKTG